MPSMTIDYPNPPDEGVETSHLDLSGEVFIPLGDGNYRLDTHLPSE